MAKIIICHPDGQEDKYGLQGGKFTIGRAPDNDIVLPDGPASNHHAVLEITGNGEYAVTDLGSTNHTRVNGTKVATKTLRHEDRILFGDTLAVYHATDPEAVPEESAPAAGAPAAGVPAVAPAVEEATAEVAPPPPPPKKAPPKKGSPAPLGSKPPVEGTGCLGLLLAAALPALGYLLLC